MTIANSVLIHEYVSRKLNDLPIFWRQWDKAPGGADTFIGLSTLPQLARSACSTPMEITMHRPNIT